jgi:gliding motility-associated-like protein
MKQIGCIISIWFCFINTGFAQIKFIENKGQWPSECLYKSEFKTGAFFIEKNGFSVVLNDTADLRTIAENAHGPKKGRNPNITLHSFCYKVKFVGSVGAKQIIPEKKEDSYNNYFVGTDSKNWAGNCRLYGAVTLKEIYPGVDIRFYNTGSNLKYDFIVDAGVNTDIIELAYEGVNQLKKVNEQLQIFTSLGVVKELAPYSYALTALGRKEVKASYLINDNRVRFKIENLYGALNKLIIDPTLVFSTFTGSTSDNFGFTATPAPDGSFFAAGIDFGTGFPVNAGAYSINNAGGAFDIGIFKFSANGVNRLYATYLGGNGSDQPHSLICDKQGNLIVYGRSNSSNYPIQTNIPNTGSNFDLVVTKFNANGNALIGSTKIGGSGMDGVNIEVNGVGNNSLKRNYSDDAKSEVMIDSSDNIILVGSTQSTNFPTVSPFQPNNAGLQDAVILKLTPNVDAITFSSYFGGASDDAAFVTKINPVNGSIVIAGATASTSLPGVMAPAISTTNLGAIDGFVSIINPNGSTVTKTTFIGTSGFDLIFGVAFDKLGFIYINGTSTGSMPVINALFSNANGKQFISKINPDLSSYVYSTKFGPNVPEPNLCTSAFLVDRCENVYVSGWGGNVNGGYANSGTNDLPLINALPGGTTTDGSDFYFFVLRKNAESQLFGSYFGQSGGVGEHVDGGTSRFDENGKIYQSICANCSSPGVTFPTTPGVWSTTNNGGNCNLAAVKIDMDFSGVAAQVQSSINSVAGDTLACVPVNVVFKDLKLKGQTYYWQIQNTAPPNNILANATTTIPQFAFTFTQVGIYRVRLIAEDLLTCNLRDTSYVNITITDRKAIPVVDIIKTAPCGMFNFEFKNNSTTNDGSLFKPKTFEWDYGDGTPKDTVDFATPRPHTFPAPGTYLVIMKIIDDDICNAPVADTAIVIIKPKLIAAADTITGACTPFLGKPKNNSIGGLTWKWELTNANGVLLNTYTDFEPTFSLNNQGVYRYRLIAFDPNTCNLSDTTKFISFEIIKTPEANFTYTPQTLPFIENTPITFINGSLFASTNNWSFGDGNTSNVFAPVHEYLLSGAYTVKLFVTNRNCIDSALEIINYRVTKQLDIPNAFTPAVSGGNKIIFVRGFGIRKMQWRIYNRWGQLVFESADKNSGWDGTYKGALQPMDVYSYTLFVEFIDGETQRKTGDISLLR